MRIRLSGAILTIDSLVDEHLAHRWFSIEASQEPGAQ